jgi:beta-lactamase regulating signal transducer with metallopeptidase domain
VIAAWGGMAAFGVSRLIQRQLLLRRLLNGRREVTDPTPLAMLAQLRRHAGVWRMVRLCTTPRASTPFAVGASEICVPERLFDALTIEERRCAIAHELAHLAPPRSAVAAGGRRDGSRVLLPAAEPARHTPAARGSRVPVR